MRFSLKQLLLLVPAWIAAYYLAPYLPVYERITFLHSIAANDIRIIRLWAANEMVANPAIRFADYDPRSLWAEVGGPLDPWGNEYIIVELNRTGVFELPSSFHVYSMGADGISKTGGNDLDDINSWDYRLDRYYRERVIAWERRRCLGRTLWLTPIIYSSCFVVVRLFRGFKQSPECRD